MSRIQRGNVNVGFFGGAEVDRYGNLNTTWVRAGDDDIRLPGSGGGYDIACMADQTVLLMPHEPRRFVEEVNYVTSPGYATDRSSRENHPAPGGGPSALVTSKATFGFDNGGKMYLRNVHPDVDPSNVLSDFS